MKFALGTLAIVQCVCSVFVLLQKKDSTKVLYRIFRADVAGIDGFKFSRF